MTIDIGELEAARDGIRPFADIPWLCRDGAGDVGIFISAGFGQIPLEIFESLEKYAAAIPHIEAAASRNGNYVYDYVRVGCLDRSLPYVQTVTPFGRIRNSSLLQYPHVTCGQLIFGDSREILIDDFFAETNI